MNWMSIGKGLRTLAVGLAIAITPAALTFFGGVDWTQFGVSPAAGALIGTVVIGLRGITTTPVGRSS
jgi:hypothetical protein